jgi:hypothetical protein
VPYAIAIYFTAVIGASAEAMKAGLEPNSWSFWVVALSTTALALVPIYLILWTATNSGDLTRLATFEKHGARYEGLCFDPATPESLGEARIVPEPIAPEASEEDSLPSTQHNYSMTITTTVHREQRQTYSTPID